MDVGDLSAPEVLGSPLMVQLVTWVAQFAIVFGGIVPYVPQYRQIRRTQNSEGFSSHVCLVLLLANILRVLFWFGRQFESALLLQSFVMIVAMLLMLQLCTAVQGSLDLTTKRHYFSGSDPYPEQAARALPRRSFLHLDLRYFWQWSRFLDYLQFVAAFSLLAASATFALLDLTAYVEALGFLATFSEAMLGTPQLYRNYRNRSTEGMSVVMVLMWTSGDTFKTVYFLAREAPPQFWVCGLMQVFVDMAILGQVFHYGRLPRHTSAHAASAGTGKAL
uniref:Solute carrier family 66 member 2 n=1 Tax=Petromyzon marinus TaxID=7757 RepID=S4R4U9_PETMA